MKLMELNFSANKDKCQQICRFVIFALNWETFLFDDAFHALATLDDKLVHFEVAGLSFRLVFIHFISHQLLPRTHAIHLFSKLRVDEACDVSFGIEFYTFFVGIGILVF